MIAAQVNALIYLVRFELLPESVHDLAGTPPLREGVDFGALIGEKALGSDWPVAELDARSAAATVPTKSNGTVWRDIGEEMRERRCRIDNFFGKIKEFRAIATRCDLTVVSFGAAISLVPGVIAPR